MDPERQHKYKLAAGGYGIADFVAVLELEITRVCDIRTKIPGVDTVADRNAARACLQEIIDTLRRTGKNTNQRSRRPDDDE